MYVCSSKSESLGVELRRIVGLAEARQNEDYDVVIMLRRDEVEKLRSILDTESYKVNPNTPKFKLPFRNKLDLELR